MQRPMPLLVLLLVAVFTGICSGLGMLSLGRRAGLTEDAAVAAGRKLAVSARTHPALRSVLRKRLDPEPLTGLALSLALVFVVCAGVVLGLLASLVRTNARLASLDNAVARWAARHASPLSTHVLNAITQLGSIYVVLGLCFVLAAVELYRTGSRSLVPFIVAVVGGEELLSTVIKDIVDRTRPAFNPAAATLGPSFPSGHSTTAAAFYAAAALLIGRRRSRATRAVVTGAGVGIAVAVAASRVLLDVHWFTDVIGGLVLGWAWFALCAIAFGGRLLRFGVPLVVAEELVQPRAADGHVNVEARTTRPGRSRTLQARRF
jgi:undecaprenyl-diphosphatase